LDPYQGWRVPDKEDGVFLPWREETPSTLESKISERRDEIIAVLRPISIGVTGLVMVSKETM